MFSAKQSCVPEKKWCLKRKRFMGEIKKVNLDWCESCSPLCPGAHPAGDESPTCVRGICESNIQQQQQPPTSPTTITITSRPRLPGRQACCSEGLDRIIKGIPPSDWHNLRVSLFLGALQTFTASQAVSQAGRWQQRVRDELLQSSKTHTQLRECSAKVKGRVNSKVPAC